MLRGSIGNIKARYTQYQKNTDMKGNQYLTDRAQLNIYLLIIYQSTRVITQN